MATNWTSCSRRRKWPDGDVPRTQRTEERWLGGGSRTENYFSSLFPSRFPRGNKKSRETIGNQAIDNQFGRNRTNTTLRGRINVSVFVEMGKWKKEESGSAISGKGKIGRRAVRRGKWKTFKLGKSFHLFISFFPIFLALCDLFGVPGQGIEAYRRRTGEEQQHAEGIVTAT